MTPNHVPYRPATGPSPYKLTISQENVLAGTPVAVDITGWRHHEGFMVQAHDADSGTAIGSWAAAAAADNSLTAPMTCWNPDDTVTHTSKVHKNDIALSWQAPTDYNGTVVFKATVVGRYSLYWTGITSAPFTVTSV